MDEILTYVVNRLLKDYPLAKKISEERMADHDNQHYGENGENIRNNGLQHSISVPAGSTSPTAIPAIHLKVFYQVTAAPSVDLLLNALHDFRQKCSETANIVYTVIPACSLHNFSTFLSICGVRHE